jgi:hypothetical protein
MDTTSEPQITAGCAEILYHYIFFEFLPVEILSTNMGREWD